MTGMAIRSTPRFSDVLAAQVRVIGSVLRRPAFVALGLVATVTLLVAGEIADAGSAIDFHPEHHVLPGLLGALFPIAVWMGEGRFGAGFLWTLPVDRRQHALIRVAAGWAWLMGAVALFMMWLLALALFSGGNVFAPERLPVLPSFSAMTPGPLDAGAVQYVQWTPTPLFWLAPFTSATSVYLFGSALALGSRYPLRWIVGTIFAFLLVVGLAEAANSDRMIALANRLIGAVINGRYGIDALLTARTESLQVSAALPTGEEMLLWRALPDLRHWAIATLLWSGAGGVLLWVAASRHREHRPS